MHFKRYLSISTSEKLIKNLIVHSSSKNILLSYYHHHHRHHCREYICCCFLSNDKFSKKYSNENYIHFISPRSPPSPPHRLRNPNPSGRHSHQVPSCPRKRTSNLHQLPTRPDRDPAHRPQRPALHGSAHTADPVASERD